MRSGKSRKILRYLTASAAGGAAIVLFLLLGPPELLAKSEAPIFCSGCHTMEEQYEAWAHAGAHRRKLCVDCHLPNENLALHYFWKSVDGMSDVVLFYSGLAKERATMSAHGAKVLQANCIRCHSSAVEFIDQDRKCWDCHRRIPHRRSGAMAA